MVKTFTKALPTEDSLFSEKEKSSVNLFALLSNPLNHSRPVAFGGDEDFDEDFDEDEDDFETEEIEEDESIEEEEEDEDFDLQEDFDDPSFDDEEEEEEEEFFEGDDSF